MKTLNFNQGCILGTSELIEYNQQLREEFKALLQEMGNSSGGVMLNRYPNAVKVSIGNLQVGGYNTISIVNSGFCLGNPSDGSYLDPVISGIDFNGLPFLRDVVDDLFIYHQQTVLNFPIPGIGTIPNSTIKYVVSVPRLTVFEEGTCNISTSGQVVFTDVRIVKKLRSQLTNSPSKITFFTNSSTKFRSGEIFEVVSIVNDTTVIISGDFTVAASNLYCAIVGSYDVQELPNLTDKYLYVYYRGDIQILDNIENIYGGVVLAKLTFNTDQSFVIQDLRKTNQYSFDPSLQWVDISTALLTSTGISGVVDLTKPYPLKVEIMEMSNGDIKVRGIIYFKPEMEGEEGIQINTSLATNKVVSSNNCYSPSTPVFPASYLKSGYASKTHAKTGTVRAVNNMGTVSSDTDAFCLFFDLPNLVSVATENYVFSFTMTPSPFIP